jgi:hypothetical protein
LADKIEGMTLPELKRERARALTEARRGKGDKRALAAQTVLLADERLGAEEPDDFEVRLSKAKVALGRAPTRDQVKAGMKAQRVRESMETNPFKRQVPSPRASFERRLASTKAALGRS